MRSLFLSVGLFAAVAPAFVGANGEDYYYGNQGNSGGEDYYYNNNYYYENQGGQQQSNVNNQYGQGGYDFNQYGQYNGNGYDWNATNSNGTMYGLYSGGQNDANYNYDYSGGNQNNDVQNGDNMYDYQDPEGEGDEGAWVNGKYHRFCPEGMQLEYNSDGSRNHHYYQKYQQNQQNDQNDQNMYGNQQYGNQYDGNYVNQQYYGNQQNANQYGEDDEDYDYSECLDYRTYTPTENCRQGIITVKSVDIKCDSPYTFYYGNGAHAQSELCDYGDKAMVTVYFDNKYDLPDKPIYWTMGIYARKSELELLWAGRNIDLCDSMVGHQCTKAGNYAFRFQVTLDWNGMSDRSMFHPIVEMGFSTEDDEGYDLGGVNIDCVFDRNYRPYNPWYSQPSVWAAGYKVTGTQGLIAGLLIAAVAGAIYAVKKQKGQIRMPWDKKRPLAEDEIYTSESGKIAEV